MDKQTASSLQRPEIRYLLILGCTVRGDQPTQLLQTRIDRAAQYLKLHPQTIAVENFTLCKHLLESREGWDETETIAFVTNDFHVARCLKIACQNRLHVVPVAAATPKHARLRCRLRECIVSISVRFSEKSG